MSVQRTPRLAADEMALEFEGGDNRASYLVVLNEPDAGEDLQSGQVDQWVETVDGMTVISGLVGGATDLYSIRAPITLFRTGDPTPTIRLDGEVVSMQEAVDLSQELAPPDNGNGEPPPDNGGEPPDNGNGNGDDDGFPIDPTLVVGVGAFALAQLLS